MKVGVGFTVIIIISVGLVCGGKEMYVGYYDISRFQDTEITIMNVGLKGANYVLHVYNAYGEQIFLSIGALDAGASAFYRLSEEIEKEPDNWGLFLIETAEKSFLALGIEYFVGDTLISIDNIVEPIPKLGINRRYWYCMYYVNAGHADTGLIVMNPWWGDTTVTVYLREQDGTLLSKRTVELSAHNSFFIDLEEYIGHSETFWGIIDVVAENPIALACEYYNRANSRLEIDNVYNYYAVQIAD